MRRKFLIIASLTALLFGCGSDNGDSNSNSGSGSSGAYKPPVEMPTPGAFSAIITSAQVINGIGKVDFSVFDNSGRPFTGLTNFSFSASSLQPENTPTFGDSSTWITITTESCSTNCSLKDHGDGTYSYVFARSFKAFNTNYANRFIIRVLPQVSGGVNVPLVDSIVDFIPNSAKKAENARLIVDTSTCKSCHGTNVISHINYCSAEATNAGITQCYDTDIRTCSTCHNKSLGNLGTGTHNLEFNQLIHQVHNDAISPSFSAQCEKCHKNIKNTPQWNNWTLVPTMQSCNSCHPTVNFSTGENHGDDIGQKNNSLCVTCHNGPKIKATHAAIPFTAAASLAMKKDGLQTTKSSPLAARLSFATTVANVPVADDIKSMILSAYTTSSSLTKDDNNNLTLKIEFKDKEGNNIDVSSILSFIDMLDVATNVGPNNPTIAAITQMPIKSGVVDNQIAKIEGSSLVVNIGSVKFGESGSDSDTASSLVGFRMCVGVQKDAPVLEPISCSSDASVMGMKASMAFITDSGDEPTMRHRGSVDFAACNTCHGDSYAYMQDKDHAGYVISTANYLDGGLAQAVSVNGTTKNIASVDSCAICHNRFAQQDDLTANKFNTIELKVHEKHNKLNISDTGNCAQCHVAPFDFTGMANKAIRIPADLNNTNQVAFASPITAVCSSCHYNETNELISGSTKLDNNWFINHAVENGGFVDNLELPVTNSKVQNQSLIDGLRVSSDIKASNSRENCNSCHILSIKEHTGITKNSSVNM